MILQATELGTAAVSNLFYRPPCGIVLKAEIVGPVTGLCIFKHDPVFVVGLAADHRKAVIISHIQVFLVNFRHFSTVMTRLLVTMETWRVCSKYS